MTYRENSQIYLIRPVGMDGPVKIGCSEMPRQRLTTLATWSPFPLEIVASFPGTFALERNLHEHFAHSHSHREWFRPTPEIIDFVAKILAGVPVEQAADLSVRFPNVYRQIKSHPKPPHMGLHMSYLHRVRHAVRRLEKETGERRFSPPQVCDALSSLSSGHPLTETRRKLLEAFIANPARKALTYEQRFPTITRWVEVTEPSTPSANHERGVSS